MELIERLLTASSRTIPWYRAAARTKIDAINSICQTRLDSSGWTFAGLTGIQLCDPIAIDICSTHQGMQHADPLWPQKVDNLWRTFNEMTMNVYIVAGTSVG